jgi:hypothetical protein
MRVRFPAILTAPLLLLLLAASACSPPPEAQGPQRIGVPPELEKVLTFGPHAGLAPATFVTLRPYDRARDLEVLLFASRSPAFAGMVVPGRWATAGRSRRTGRCAGRWLGWGSRFGF